MRIFWLILLFAGCFVVTASAQKPDTLRKRRLSAADSIQRADSIAGATFLRRATTAKANKKFDKPDSTHSPHKAVMRSLMIPGWGQVYNKHYWKVPIVVGGLGVTIYYLIYNNNEYVRYLAIAKFQQTGKSWTDPQFANDKYLSDYRDIGSRQQASAVIEFKDYWRRNRDLLILGFILGWGVQTIDAYVWAKFKHSYSMDNDLSIRFSGGVMPVYAANNTTFVPALKITLKL